MNTTTLTNILLTGIMLMQAYAIIFRAPAVRRPLNWREIETAKESNDPPHLPLS